MPSKRKIAAVCAAAIAVVGVAGIAASKIADTHVIKVSLPDGSVARVQYVGAAPPHIAIAPVPVTDVVVPSVFGVLAAEPPFAALDRAADAMDRQADAMLRTVGMMPVQVFSDPDNTAVAVSRLPTGVSGVTTISTLTGKGVCTRSVEYRSLGAGRAPEVITRTSGACSEGSKPPVASPSAVGKAQPARGQMT